MDPERTSNKTRGTLVHASAIAFGSRAVLLRGPSGIGKSDLALRLVNRPCNDPLEPNIQLICDDYVDVFVDQADQLMVQAGSERIRGLLEVRGVGIFQLPTVQTAALALVVDLAPPDGTIPRLPDEDEGCTLISGRSIPRITVKPFEVSAVDKVMLAMSGTRYDQDASSC